MIRSVHRCCKTHIQIQFQAQCHGQNMSKQSLCGSIHWESLHWILLEHFYAQGRVLSDHHVQLSDHSICCECLRKCSAGHASTAHKRHFLGPASAGLQPFVAALRMVPAHVQSDSMMKDSRHQVSHYLKVSAALTQPSWTFLPESSPSHRFLLPETDKAVIINNRTVSDKVIVYL